MAQEWLDGESGQLRYLDAEHVRSALGPLSGLTVRTQDGRPLGEVDGVLINPLTRRLRYLVVRTSGLLLKHRVLVSADQGPAIVEPHSRTLRLQQRGDEIAVQKFDAHVPAFSDDDVITAMFAPRAA